MENLNVTLEIKIKSKYQMKNWNLFQLVTKETFLILTFKLKY